MPKSDNFSSNQKESQEQEKKDRFTVVSQAAVPSLYLANIETLVSPIEELKQTFEYLDESVSFETDRLFFGRRLSLVANPSNKIIKDENGIPFPSKKYITMLTQIAIEREFDVNLSFESGMTLLHYCIFHRLHDEIECAILYQA